MRPLNVPILALALALTSVGCGERDEYVPPSDDDDADIVSCMDGLEAKAEDSAPSDEMVVDWSGVTQDLEGNPVDPAVDVDQLVVSFMDADFEEVAEALCDDNLQQDDLLHLWEDNSVQGDTLALVDASGMENTVAAVVVAGDGRRIALALAEILAGLADEGILVTD